MSFTQNFTAAQATGLPSTITLTDTSTGSDASIASRYVYLIKDDATYLAPLGTLTDYIVWAYANVSINIDALTSDMALNVRVDWLDSGGTVLYTKTILYIFDPYSKTFLYSLSQLQSSSNIGLDSNFASNKAILWSLVKDAENAVTVGGDITTAQNCLNIATNMITYQSKYF